MSKSDDPDNVHNNVRTPLRNQTRGPKTGNYDVGHGKPPVDSQWKKGQSGNPHGRPSKSDTEPFVGKSHPIRDAIFDELERMVPIKEGGSTSEITTLSAIIRSINVGAIKGNHSQQKLAIRCAIAADESRRTDIAAGILNVEDYKHKWGPVFSQARQHASPEPRQVPHPDHININLQTGDFVISGPLTPSDKKAWDHLKFQLRQTECMLIKQTENAAVHPQNREEKTKCEHMKNHLKKLEKRVPKGWNWRERLGWEESYDTKMIAETKMKGSSTTSVN